MVPREMSRKMANRKASFLVRLMERREQDYLRSRDDAVAKGRWSQVAGYDGIAIGMQIAQGMVKHEFNLRRRRKRPSTRLEQE